MNMRPDCDHCVRPASARCTNALCRGRMCESCSSLGHTHTKTLSLSLSSSCVCNLRTHKHTHTHTNNTGPEGQRKQSWLHPTRISDGTHTHAHTDMRTRNTTPANAFICAPAAPDGEGDARDRRRPSSGLVLPVSGVFHLSLSLSLFFSLLLFIFSVCLPVRPLVGPSVCLSVG